MKTPIYKDPKQRALVAILNKLPPRQRVEIASDIAVLTQYYGIEYDISSDKRTKKMVRATYEITINGTTTRGHTSEEAAKVAGISTRSLANYMRLRDNVYTTCINVLHAKAFRQITIRKVLMDCTPAEVGALREAG